MDSQLRPQGERETLIMPAAYKTQSLSFMSSLSLFYVFTLYPSPLTVLNDLMMLDRRSAQAQLVSNNYEVYSFSLSLFTHSFYALFLSFLFSLTLSHPFSSLHATFLILSHSLSPRSVILHETPSPLSHGMLVSSFGTLQ